MKRALLTSAVASAAVLGSVAACDDVSGPGGEPLSLLFSVPSSGNAAAAGDVTLQTSADQILIIRGSQRLMLNVVELRLSRIDLEPVDDLEDRDTDLDTDRGQDSDVDTDSDQRDNVRFRGPVTVRLPLQGGVIGPFRAEIPVGTYDEVKFRVETARLVGAFDENRNGTFEASEAFDVTVPVREKFEIELDDPLVINDAANITIRLNPPQWFRNNDGSLFNPRRLNNDQQLRARFRQLVRATLRAFEDANRNGNDDRDTDSDR
ncbi:MAG: hypothetical protein ABR499_11375 [Gemmatimonadaceae bacterium]